MIEAFIYRGNRGVPYRAIAKECSSSPSRRRFMTLASASTIPGSVGATPTAGPRLKLLTIYPLQGAMETSGR